MATQVALGSVKAGLRGDDAGASGGSKTYRLGFENWGDRRYQNVLPSVVFRPSEMNRTKRQ